MWITFFYSWGFLFFFFPQFVDKLKEIFIFLQESVENFSKKC
ncbi:hypothetical protein RV11_GL002357 [Enterococcus phoeniculicola]|nr:hypothetical protein RV11_GL002357 [Enterococcus phoeniculicola]